MTGCVTDITHADGFVRRLLLATALHLIYSFQKGQLWSLCC